MTKPRVVLPGIIVGVLLLGLAVVFAVVLPKAHGETGDLSLPATLPGGYGATDTVAAFEKVSGVDASSIKQYAAAEAAANKFAAASFDGVDVEGVSRTYLSKDGQSFIAVQLMRADGGALSPYVFADPATAQSGTQVQHLVDAGDATCIETGVADGSGALQQPVIQCQKSDDGLTLQVTTQSQATTKDPVADAGKLVDTIWDKVA